MTETEVQPRNKKVQTFYGVLIGGIALALLISFFIIFSLTTPPENQITGQTILKVEQGMSVKTITESAKRVGVVKSELMLYAVLTYFHDPTAIQAGRYVFSEPLTVFEVAEKLASSDTKEELITLTIPEGIRLTQVAEIAAKTIPDFSAEEYLQLTENMEGYLFPETYFVPEGFSAADLVDLQKRTYEDKIAPLREKIAQSQFTEYEVLVLASLIEREANDAESMKTISSVYHNRLEIGMALQADASIEYVLDKPLAELTSDDLKIDSPYNTYLNPGLIPTPIGNPGLLAIDAVLNPYQTEYFYYITDENGDFYYAKTFDEHKRNVAKYLK